MNSPILDLVYLAIDELNQQFEGEKTLIKSETTTLYGKTASLDSLELINLIVILEQKLEDAFNVHIVLADERVLQMRNNPFESVNSLVDYVEMLCDEKHINYYS